MCYIFFFFFFSSRRRHTRSDRDWSSDVCSSDLPPGQVDAHWFGTQRDEDLVQALKVALESGRLRESLEKLESQHAQYAALKTVLARYREVAAAGGWSALPAGWTPRAGRPDPKVAVLRAHLIATGDLPQPAATPAAAPVFDA